MADWYSAGNTEKVPLSSKQNDDIFPYQSRRSPVICRHGCVASSQPLASSIGLDILRKGGNAADAAIAVGATLCVVEPCSTGLGGDMFCLYYDSSLGKVSCINGSGRSPENLTLDALRKKLPGKKRESNSDDDDNGDHESEVDVDRFRLSVHAITVPGAAKGYEDLYKRHGSGTFTFLELLMPAITLAEEGFPVAPMTSYYWRNGIPLIKKWCSQNNKTPLTVDGVNGPSPGDIMVNKDMGRVLRELGKHGAAKGFYDSVTGRAIVDAIQKHGGLMGHADLLAHTSTFPEPISAQYRSVKLWQVPPNGQGVAACIALKGLQYLEQRGWRKDTNGEGTDDSKADQSHAKHDFSITPQDIGTSPDLYHAMIEMMRLGFKDARSYVACPDHHDHKDMLLDDQRIAKEIEETYDPQKAKFQDGIPESSSCTVSFQVVDARGNAISFVNSNFMGFGTGLVPEGCGFTLQNRGFGFTVDDANHPNALGPRKRPYHTIIPGMLTHVDRDDDRNNKEENQNINNKLYATLSNMGGYMQPQGHLQLTVNLIAGGLDPQRAIDMPRFCIMDGTHNGVVSMEEGFSEEILHELGKARGHKMKTHVRGFDRSAFGRAQIIVKDKETGVLWAGSDGRADGCAMGY